MRKRSRHVIESADPKPYSGCLLHSGSASTLAGFPRASLETVLEIGLETSLETDLETDLETGLETGLETSLETGLEAALTFPTLPLLRA